MSLTRTWIAATVTLSPGLKEDWQLEVTATTDLGRHHQTDFVDSGFTAFGPIAEGRIPSSLFEGHQYVTIEMQIKNGCETGYCDIVLLPDLIRPDSDSDGIFDFGANAHHHHLIPM
jgi:hypothetical protein